MKKATRIGIIGALLVVVGAVMALKQKDRETTRSGDQTQTRADAASRPAEAADGQEPAMKKPLPRLVDLGAGKCVPCKKMAPILETLKKEYAGRMNVEFIDVWENPNAGDLYGIQMIPTQIFYDASGTELFRHEGFYSREDILGKWKELGVDLIGKVEAQQ